MPDDLDEDEPLLPYINVTIEVYDGVSGVTSTDIFNQEFPTPRAVMEACVRAMRGCGFDVRAEMLNEAPDTEGKKI